MPTKNKPVITVFFMPIFLVMVSFSKMVIRVVIDDKVTRNSALVIEIPKSLCIKTRVPVITLLPATYIASDNIAMIFFVSLLTLIPS